MTVQAMGYFWVGTSKLDDWSSLAVGQLGLQPVDRGGNACVPHGRPKAAPDCRWWVDGRRAFFRLGGRGRDGARCTGGAAGKGRRRGAAGNHGRGGPTLRRRSDFL